MQGVPIMLQVVVLYDGVSCSNLASQVCSHWTLDWLHMIWVRFLSLARSKLRLCSANHRAGYFSNLACDWLSIVWAYSEQETENGPWCSSGSVLGNNLCGVISKWIRYIISSLLYMISEANLEYTRCKYWNLIGTSFFAFYITMK